MGFPANSDEFWVVLDREGQIREGEAPPTTELREPPPPVRAPFVSADMARGVWGAVFAWGSPLLIYDGRELRCSGRLIEGGPFPPEPGPDNQVWAVGLAVADTSVFVLPPGETDHDLRILDEYDIDSCRYLRSIRLPRQLQAVAWDEDTFYSTTRIPRPHCSPFVSGRPAGGEYRGDETATADLSRTATEPRLTVNPQETAPPRPPPPPSRS